jgi:hypothetical protein
LSWFEGARVCVCSSWAWCCICVGLGWLGNGLAYLVGARLLKGVISLHMRKPPPPPPPHSSHPDVCIRSEQDAGYLVRLQACAHPQASTHSRTCIGLSGDGVMRYQHSLPSHLPTQPASLPQAPLSRHSFPSGHAYPLRTRKQVVPFNWRVYAYARVLRIPAPASGWLEMGSCLRPSVPHVSQHGNITPAKENPLHASAPVPFRSAAIGSASFVVSSMYLVYVPIPPWQTQDAPREISRHNVKCEISSHTALRRVDLFCTWI